MTTTNTIANGVSISELKWTLAHVADAMKKTGDAAAEQSLCYASQHLLAMIERASKLRGVEVG